MYTFFIGDSNEIISTKKENVMQRSKLVDSLMILTNPLYNGIEMNDCTVLMEYVTPNSHEYKTEFLELSEELYQGKLKYLLPFNTSLTKEDGIVEFQITFSKVELDVEGIPHEFVRKTYGGKIRIIPISAWSDLIPDEALTPLDQRILKNDAQIKALSELANDFDLMKADNISYENEKLQLESNGKKIGREVTIINAGDGIPVVEFSANTSKEDTN